MKQMRDVKSWMTPHMDSISYHSNPHCFKMVSNEDGDVEVFYKKWMTGLVFSIVRLRSGSVLSTIIFDRPRQKQFPHNIISLNLIKKK